MLLSARSWTVHTMWVELTSTANIRQRVKVGVVFYIRDFGHTDGLKIIEQPSLTIQSVNIMLWHG